MMVKPIAIILFLICSIRILISCTTAVPYPEGWPEITKVTKECKNLEGKYKNYNGEFYLSDLFGIEDIILNQDQVIQIAYLNDKSIKLSVIENSIEKTYFNITFEQACDNGTIAISGKPEFYIHPWIITSSLPMIKINTANDQSLIANIEHRTNSFAFLILPIRSNYIEWRRWESSSK